MKKVQQGQEAKTMDNRDSQTSTRWSRHKAWLKTQLGTRLVPLAFIASLTVQADSCGTSDDFGLDEREFLCDDASAKLTECCGHGVGLYCTRPQACSHKYPDLSVDAALCVRESSCETLVSAGLCEISSWKIAAESGAPGSIGSPAYVALKALPCY